MRLFVLRHEQRPTNDPTFWSSLTQQGLRNALYNVAPDVHTIVIPTHVYSSPLLRCVQTIAPYCTRFNRKGTVCLEPSLYERVRDKSGPGESKTFDPHTFRSFSVLNRTEHNQLHEHICREHVPFAPSDVVKWGESEADVRDRVVPFLRHLIQTHGCDSGARILLVTHLSVADAILNTGTDDSAFPMGHLKEVEVDALRQRLEV